jgi:glucosamine-6-phosphate deaminase
VTGTVDTPLRVFPTPDAIGEYLAQRLPERIALAGTKGRRFLLGCPTGRTPRPVYAALGRELARRKQDISNLVLVMMDEYLVQHGNRLVYAPPDQPWSCHHFVRAEIAARLNAGLGPNRRLTEERVWFPDPRDPGAYDARIADAGGIDFFILASGASDGHVAFNPPGSERNTRTRIVELSESTRRDNLMTFPAFGSIDSVPGHGVTVGIDTIIAAKEAAMIVWGAGKSLTLARIKQAKRYEPEWPATVIQECSAPEILSDVAAARSFAVD